MADARKIHPQAGMDAKLATLTDFDVRVWWQYVSSANDLGVMPAIASVLQAGNRRLAQLPARRVQGALERIIDAGLLAVFEHDGVRYCWSRKWQDWQDIRYPRLTPWAVPQDLSVASPATQKLFAVYKQKVREHSEKTPNDFGNASEAARREFVDARHPAGEGGRASAPSAQAGSPNPNPNTSSEVEFRGGVGEPPDPATKSMVVAPLYPHANPAALINGADNRRHGSHAWCDHIRQLCVPSHLHREFQARGLKTDAELKAWYPAVVASLAGCPVGNDIFEFWKGMFAQWVGTLAVRPVSRPATAVESNLRGLAEDVELLERHRRG